MTQTTLGTIATQLEELLDYLDTARSGKPMYWTNTTSGEQRTANADDHLSFIEDRLLMIASDVESLQDNVKVLLTKGE